MVPITPNKLSGDILEAYHRNYLSGPELSEWAEALILAGYDSDAINEALANPDSHWQELPELFKRICRDVGLSPDVSIDTEQVKKEAMIEEFRCGHRRGAELFQRFDDLRQRAGFAEPIHFRLMQDNPDETNDSGYYTDSMSHGPELEAMVVDALRSIGIIRADKQ